MKGKQKLIIPYLFPALFMYIVFLILPAIYGIYISFQNWAGFTDKMLFVGLNNYKELLSDDVYWSTFKTTMIITIVGGVFVFLIGFIFTAMMSQGIKGKKVVRAVIFFPQIIAPIALAIVWNYLYRYDIGLFNSVLTFLGFDPVNWTGPKNILFSAVVAIIWYSVGFYAVILMAGIDKIPNTIFESARIEGASTFRIFWKITIPLIWDVLSIAIILWTINSIRVFDFLYAFGGPDPPQSVWNLALYQFILGFGTRDAIYQLGYSSAIATTIIIIVAVLVLAFRKLLKREVYEL